MSALPETVECDPSKNDIAAKVLKQLEFYFGNSNFRRDKFMKEEAKKDEEGFISVDILLKFNRLKGLIQKAELPEETLYKAYVAAVAAHSKDVIVVKDDQSALRRKNPLRR